jgi:hypothetical protein
MSAMSELLTLCEAVGGGASVLIWNFWNSRRVERQANKVDKRNEAREPFLLDSIELSNVGKVTEIFRQGIEELEDSKQRLLEDKQEIQQRYEMLEDKWESATNENRRLRDELLDINIQINSLKKGKSD